MKISCSLWRKFQIIHCRSLRRNCWLIGQKQYRNHIPKMLRMIQHHRKPTHPPHRPVSTFFTTRSFFIRIFSKRKKNSTDFLSFSLAPDIADISRIFFEVIRSELNANQMPEFVLHEKPCSAHTNTGDMKSMSTSEQDSNQSKSMYINIII